MEELLPKERTCKPILGLSKKGKSKPVYVLAGRAGDKVKFLEQSVNQF
jgi:hypothetical protein